MPESSEIIGQQKIVFDRTDPRSLTEKQLRKLRIVPIGKERETRKKILERKEDTAYSRSKETRYVYKSLGFAGPKQDSEPNVQGEVSLKGGYLALEIAVARKERSAVGTYVALETIFLTDGPEKRIKMGQTFYALRSDTAIPRALVDQVLSER